MVGTEMVRRGTSIRKLAAQLGVTDGALRYQFRRQAAAVPDGRAGKPTSVDGFEETIDTILKRLEDSRVTGKGRPVQALMVCEILRRDYEYQGSYRAVVRHLRRRFGVPPIRALRRVETPPGVQAQGPGRSASEGTGLSRVGWLALISKHPIA